MNLKVSIDGGFSYVEAEEVRIEYDFPEAGEQLHLIMTHEGVITDVIKDGEVVGTESEMAGDIIDRLWEAP